MDEKTKLRIKCLVMLPFSPVRMVLEAYVISKLWLWFVVPVFSLSALTMAQAFGLSLVVASLTVIQNVPKEKELTRHFWYGFTFPLFQLFLGWIVKSWFM